MVRGWVECDRGKFGSMANDCLNFFHPLLVACAQLLIIVYALALSRHSLHRMKESNP